VTDELLLSWIDGGSQIKCPNGGLKSLAGSAFRFRILHR
jgi:hypothetical protein